MTDDHICFFSFFFVSRGGQEIVLGTIIFANAYVVTLPSWLNEKRHNVNIKKTIW